MKTQNKIPRYVNLQCFLLYLCIFTFICIGCGGGGGGGSNDDADQGAELNAIVISPKAAMLTKSGQTEQFIYTAYNNGGNEISASLEWSSTNPDAVSVDGNGMVTTLADIGSALITASSGGVVSNEVMIVIAEPVQGAVLVSDDQVVGDIELEDPNAEFELGLRLIVRLSGVAPPAVGTILLGTGEKPVGGKVVSAVQDGDEVVVVIELVTIEEMFADLLIDEEIDLSSQVPIISEIINEYYDMNWQPDGSMEFTLKQQIGASIHGQSPRSMIPVMTSPLNPDANYGPFKCECDFANPLVLDAFPTGFSIDNNLSLDFEYDILNGGLQHLLVIGDLMGAFNLSNTLTAALQAKVGCKTKIGEIPFPLPGALAFLTVYVPIGVGFELDGKLTLAQLGFKFTAEAKADLKMGMECSGGSDCDMVADIDPSASADWDWITPDLSGSLLATLAQMRLEPSLSAFVFSEMELGFTGAFVGFDPRLTFAQAQAGLKQTGNFANVEGQMDDASYSSDYSLAFEGGVGAGLSIDGVAGILQVNLLKHEDKVTVPVATSPKVISAVADTSAFKQGDKVKFAIDFDPNETTFPIYGYTPLFQYNLSKILIYRQTKDDFGGIGKADLLYTLIPVAPIIPAQYQTQFEIEWIADSEGTIDGNYFVFVETKAWPFTYFGHLEMAEIQPPPPQVNTEIKVGTASGFLQATYYDFRTTEDDSSWPEAGVPLNSTGTCEYSGGQSTSGGSTVDVSDEVSIENQTADGSFTALGGGSNATFSFSASASASPGTAPSLASRGRGVVDIGTNAQQVALIVENLTTGPVDVHINWGVTNTLTVSGYRCEAKASYSFGISGGGGTQGNYRKSCNGSVYESGQQSGSHMITLNPGKHCLSMSANVSAEVEADWDFYESSSTSEAEISGTVNISVR